MKRPLLIAIAIFACLTAAAQEFRRFTVPIEYVGTPIDNGLRGEERIDDKGQRHNVTKADMTVFLPDSGKPTSCIVIFPGGAYSFVNMIGAGETGAEIFARGGVAAIVVKYRLPNGNPMVPYEDGIQAIRMARSKAKEWNLDPEKIGILGSSAGGHLASLLCVHQIEADPASQHELERHTSRPDFCVYMKSLLGTREFETHQPSFKNVWGSNPTDETRDFCYTLDLIGANHPPTFIMHTYNDAAVPVVMPLRTMEKLRGLDIPAEMHVFVDGGHGMGYLAKDGSPHPWTQLLLDWKYLK